MQTRPNVLFIVADQHSHKCVGSYGHAVVRTPNLDGLAAEGTRFTHAVCQNPICTPSRVSFLSGQYCHNHGYYGLSGPHPGGLPSVLSHFRAAGYATGAFGKIHCPEYWLEGHSDVFKDPGNTSAGGRCPEYTAFLRACGVEHLEDDLLLTDLGEDGRQSKEGRPSQIAFEQSQDGWAAGEAAKFIHECGRSGQPFMAHVSFTKPHQCYTPAREFWEMYRFESLALPPSCDWPHRLKAPNLTRVAEMFRRGDWARYEPRSFEAARLRKLRGYYGNISHVDHAVGVLLRGLESAGLADNTVVVYTADHGEYACEFDIMEKAPGICGDCVTRVPFIWRVPWLKQRAAVCDALVENVDISQTLCALAGVEPLQTSDGKDLSPLLRGEDATLRAIAVCEHPWSRAVYHGKWRMVWYPRERFPAEYPDGFGELYDLQADPWEMRNVYFEPSSASIIAELKDRLLDWQVTTTRPTSALQVNFGQRRVMEPDRQTTERFGVLVNSDRKVHPDFVGQAIARGMDNYL